MIVAAKQVTWTIAPNRPRKPEVDMIYSVASEIQKMSVTMSQNNYLIPLLTGRFSTETALRGSLHSTSPLPEEGLIP